MIVLLFAFCNAEAETIAYWRFEKSSGFLNDSGPNGISLINNGTAGQASPDSGSGTDFCNPIPLTGQKNITHAYVVGDKIGQSLSAGNHDMFDVGDFTLECFVSIPQIHMGKNADIVAKWNKGDKSFRLLKNVANQLSLGLSDPSGNLTFFTAGDAYAIEANKDYYVGVVVDIEPANQTKIVFYLQCLTDGGDLQKVMGYTRSINLPSQIRSSQANLIIGGSGVNTNGLSGRVDEVRLSRGRLTVEQLLIYSDDNSKQSYALLPEVDSIERNNNCLVSGMLNRSCWHSPGTVLFKPMRSQKGPIFQQAVFQFNSYGAFVFNR